MPKKKMTFRTFDIAEHLDSPEIVAAFLTSALEDAGGDTTQIRYALNIVARAHNISQLARETGITREGLYQALSPDGNPSFVTMTKLLGAMGMSMKITPAK